jgi:hypothetical protein
MALSGWNSSSYVSLGSGLLTAAPATLACFARTSITGVSQRLLGLHNSASASNRNYLRLGITAANEVVAVAADASGTSDAASVATISANTWHHFCAVFGSTTSRSVYLDGANKVTDSANRPAPTGVNRVAVGVDFVSGSAGNPLAPSGTGLIAEVGIWNVALSDEDVAALAKGIPPIMIRPQNLVAYLPLIRDLIDLKGNAFAITGSLTAADHPRMYAPI